MVNTGEGAPIQIVCGAPNARGGMKAVLGRPGTYIPGKKITLELTPEAKRALTTEGYDPTFEARPLKRAIQRLIQNPLSSAILSGRFQDGDHIVATEGPDGEIEFTKAESAQQEPAVAAR